MPIDPKEALGYLGADPDKFESLEDFKAHFDSEWAKASELSAQQGRINAAFRSSIARASKELGIDIDRKVIDEAPKPTEVLEQIIGKAKETWTGRLSQLEEAAKGKGSEKIKEEYEARLAQIAKDAETFKADAQKWQGEYTNLTTTLQKQKEEQEINGLYAKAMESVKLRELTPLEKQGFEVFIKSNYKPVKEGDAYAWVGPDGNKIKDDKRAAAFKSIEQLVAEAAEQHKLVATNPHAQKPIGRNEPPPVVTPPGGATRKRLINPLAQ